MLETTRHNNTRKTIAQSNSKTLATGILVPPGIHRTLSCTHNQKDNQNDNEQSSLCTLAFLLLLLRNSQHQSKEP